MKQNYFFHLTIAMILCTASMQASELHQRALVSSSSSSSSSSPRATSIEELMQRKTVLDKAIEAEIEDWRENGSYSCCRKRPWQITSNGCLTLAGFFCLGMCGVCLDEGRTCEPWMAGSITAGLVFSSAAHAAIECFDITPKSIAEEKKAELADIREEIARLTNEQAKEKQGVFKTWKEYKIEKLLREKSE